MIISLNVSCIYSQQDKILKSHYLALCISMHAEFHTCPMKLFSSEALQRKFTTLAREDVNMSYGAAGTARVLVIPFLDLW